MQIWGWHFAIESADQGGLLKVMCLSTETRGIINSIFNKILRYSLFY